VRVLPLPALAVAELRLHLSQYPLRPAGLLFTTPAGTVLNQNNWRRREWNSARVWAYCVSRDVTFHRLWHTYASLLINQNVHSKVLQVRLEHASAAETMDTYGHLYADADQSTRVAIDTAFRATPGSLEVIHRTDERRADAGECLEKRHSPRHMLLSPSYRREARRSRISTAPWTVLGTPPRRSSR
jgi:hypothetical protein